MSRSSAGGAAAAGGEGHQARCLAWAAAYMLAEEPLPEFALGRRVVAIGAQTERSVDDVAFLTDEDGWVMVQAKKGLRLTQAPEGDLAKALDQVAELARTGLPAGLRSSSPARQVDPGRDRVLIVSDETASVPVGRDLHQVVNRLRTLSPVVPVDETAKNEDERRALELVKQHLRRAWETRYDRSMSETDLRAVCHSLGVQVLDLSDGGSHRTAAEQLLRGLLPPGANVSTVWGLLVQQGQELAEERTFVDRAELVRLLKNKGIVLSPVARLRPDIQRLREYTQTNIDLLGNDRFIVAPEGAVEVDRSTMAALATADGNVAITGGSGAGKSTELYRMAVALRQQGADVVVLRADDLHGTSGQTRQELNLAHDLAEVLVGWAGPGGATLLLDGLDQTRGEDASGWLAALANQLAGTRWRVVASIRSYDLKHSRNWRTIFVGTPTAQLSVDPAFAGIRHVYLGDFDDRELALVAAQSPRLAELLETADLRLRALLANPFNLDLAAQLLRTGDLDPSSVRSRIDLLHQYWEKRVYGHDARRVATLRVIAELMVHDGRQVISLAYVDGVDHAVVKSLCSDGVLRELPLKPGHAAPDIEFAHPVLFDYAVALLVLGDTARPASLAEKLDERPNLALTVRPSIELRLATIWREDDSRAEYWQLGLRLISRSRGHVLVALQAAQLAALEIQSVTDCGSLVDAYTGTSRQGEGQWTTDDARRLTFLLAASASRSGNPHADEAVAALASDLASRAAQSSDMETALLAAQLAHRVITGNADPNLNEYWATVAASCVSLALAHRSNATSPLLVEISSHVLAFVAATDSSSVKVVIEQISQPELLHVWGAGHMRALVDRIGDIAGADPELAVTIGASVWEFNETRDEPTSLIRSAILPMSTTLKDDLKSVRGDVGRRFAVLAEADLSAATFLLLRVVERPDMYRYPSSIEFDSLPRPRIGAFLRFSADHDAPMTMTKAWIARLQREADSVVSGAPGDWSAADHPYMAAIIEQILSDLRHADVWAHLLHQAAAADSMALARVLLPALTSPNLYVLSTTWVPAAHLARRVSPLLGPDDHAALEQAILNIDQTGRRTVSDEDEFRAELRSRADAILAALLPERLQLEEARQRAAARVVTADTLPPLTEPGPHVVAAIRTPGTECGPAGSQQQDISDLINRAASPDAAERASASQAIIDAWDGILEPAQRLSVAARLAREPEVSPATTLGRDVYEVLRAGLAEPATGSPPGESGDLATTPILKWAPGADALTGLVTLVCRPDWQETHGNELRSLLTPYLDSPNPTFRYLASHALPRIIPDAVDVLDDIARRLEIEQDYYVVTILLQLLNRYVPSRAQDIDSIMERLLPHSPWTLTANVANSRLPRNEEITYVEFSIIAALGVAHAAPFASQLIQRWFTKPQGYAQQITHVLVTLRDVLNPSGTSLQTVQAAAFKLLRDGARACRDAWYALENQRVGESTGSDEVANVTKVSIEISEAIYFASGVLDHLHPQANDASHGNLGLFCELALPILDVLTDVPHPAATRHIVQTCIYLADCRPAESLKIVARAIVGDEAYTRERIGLDDVISLVQRYLVDHGSLLRDDVECLTALRRVIEVFILAGWDRAIDLAEELDELFE